jgi:hypothetical protein
LAKRNDTFVIYIPENYMQLKDQIEAIANTLLPSFIPKDPAETSLSFHFTLPPDSSYRVFFEKDSKAKWQFLRYEDAIR